MVYYSSVSALVAISSLALAMPATKAITFRKLDNPPSGWERHGAANIDKTNSPMKLKIYLKQPRMAEFQDLALKIATPGDELYGNHLSQQQIDEMLAPEREVVEQISNWLKSEGLNNVKLSERNDALVVECNVSDAEKLLQTEYNSFIHQETGNTILRTLEYSLPDSVRDHVQMIEPSTFFGFKKNALIAAPVEKRSVDSSQACSQFSITPSCLSSLYSYSDAKPYSNGMIGIGGFLEEYPSTKDLQNFMNKYATQNNKDQSYSCVTVNGGKCPTSGQSTLEADLDTQYVRAITEKIPNVYYSTGGRPPENGVNNNEPYLEFLNYMLGLSADKLPQTLTISYVDTEPSVPTDYQQKTCDLFSQLGAKGVSILVASGDAGVGSNCPGGKYVPGYPAACPWVTAVGGTTGTGPESGWSGSGGGFSNVFAQPSWQADAVNEWLKNNGNSDKFNSSGRAFPDVSAQATNFQVVVNGGTQSVYGTSCSSPTFASLIQLINSDRLQNGKKPLGFLNPWIYSKAPPGLTDITKGGNTGCNSGGFKAVAGWDPATGLGTPVYDKLYQIAQSD